MADMARAVEAVGRTESAAPPPIPPQARPIPPLIPDPRPTMPLRSLPSAQPEPTLTALPAFTMRDKVGELSPALPLKRAVRRGGDGAVEGARLPCGLELPAAASFS